MDFKEVDFTKYVNIAEENSKKEKLSNAGKKGGGFDLKALPYMAQMIGMFLSPKIKAILISIVLFSIIGIASTIYFITTLIIK